MARAPAKPKATGTAVVNWEEQMEKEAALAAAQEANTGGGSFFSLKAGQLSFNDSPVPGNKMAAYIVDGIMENVFYEGEYDPDNPAPPTCYAFGRDEAEMAPFASVVDAGNAQSGMCHDCPNNQWGSAEKGRGKACSNRRRLALVPAGTFNAKTDEFTMLEPEYIKDSPIAFMKLPVMSVNGYGAYVKKLAGVMRRAPHRVVTLISVVPDTKAQFKVVFEPICNAPNEYMEILTAKHEEAMATIETPYPLPQEAPPPPPPKGRAVAGKKPAPAAPKARGKY